MSRSPVSFPSPEEGLRLHLRLGEQDPLAPSDACKAYVYPLCDWLGSRFRDVDPHLIQSAVHDALIGYVQRPRCYDPRRGDLALYLRMAARWDLANHLRREGRHHERRVPWSVVELGEEGGNLSGREEEPVRQLEQDEEAVGWQVTLRALRGRLPEADRPAFDLMLAGERDTRVFAAALGLEALPIEEQACAVKRVKDRILKRLKREGQGHD
jgi:RNA polymerase sigma-70 factor, ECF subfamily